MIEKISVALTPDIAAVIRKAVESGGYASNSEVVREALRDWEMKQLVRQHQIEEIRRLLDEGIASGSAGPFDLEEFKKEARRRFNAEQAEQ